MSNTTITPTVGAATAAGVAAALGLALQSPAQAQGALVGVAPTVTATGAVNPPNGLPVSWSGLRQNSVGAAAPPSAWVQARFAVSGVFGSYGSLQIQGSPDGVSWTTLAATSGAANPDVTATTANRAVATGGLNGLQAIQLPSGVLVLSMTDLIGPAYLYLRPAVVGGDGTTTLTVTGNISTTGAV